MCSFSASLWECPATRSSDTAISLLSLFHLIFLLRWFCDVVVVNCLKSYSTIEAGRCKVSDKDVDTIYILKSSEYSCQRAEKDTPTREYTKRPSRLVDIVGVYLRGTSEDNHHDVTEGHELQNREGEIWTAHEGEPGGVSGNDGDTS